MKIVKSEEDLLEFDNGLKIEGEGVVECPSCGEKFNPDEV